MNITITQDQELELSSRIKRWGQERTDYLLADDTAQALMVEDMLHGAELVFSVLGLTELELQARNARQAALSSETKATK